MYNGKPSCLIRTADGARASSIELGGGIVNWGCRWIARDFGVSAWPEPSDPVFPDDLEAAKQAPGVRVEPGDILFVRTGLPRQLAH